MSPPLPPAPLSHLCYPIFAQHCHVWQAVIFLFEHSDKASAGFILNKPTEHKLGKIVGADELCPEFADNLLYLGGDVGSDTMHFIHGCSDIQVSGRHKQAHIRLRFLTRQLPCFLSFMCSSSTNIIEQLHNLSATCSCIDTSVCMLSCCCCCQDFMHVALFLLPSCTPIPTQATAFNIHIVSNRPKLVTLSSFNALLLCIPCTASVDNAKLHQALLQSTCLCILAHDCACKVEQSSQQEIIMQGAQEVVKGVFMGGFEEARYGIRSGSNKAEHFR